MNASPEQVVGMMLEFIKDLQIAENVFEDKIHEEVRQHRSFIEAYAASYREVKGPNREYRNAVVDDETREERFVYESAVADAKVAYQRLLNKRHSLSALQSAARSVTEEAAFSRTSPLMDERYPQ